MSDRDALIKAISILSKHRDRFGVPAVATTIAVLNERLANYTDGDEETSVINHLPEQPAVEQRKQVSILFVAIEGFTHLDGISHNTGRLRQIDLVWQLLDETIREYDGLVDKHMGDVIMGLFGVPIARENDTERAIRCALAIRDLIDEFLTEQRGDSLAISLSQATPVVRMGINTGPVVLGQLGSDSGLTVIGDAVNVASRLKETRAESGIYISQDVYRLVNSLFKVEALGDIRIKGRQMPVEVFRVTGLQPRPLFTGKDSVEGIPVTMIGRSAELGILQAAYEDTARTRTGRVITLVGEAGIGKSRLLREFHAWMEANPTGVNILYGHTDQRSIHVPYSLLRDLLANQLTLAETGAVNFSDQIHWLDRIIGSDLEGTGYVTGDGATSSSDSDQAEELDSLLSFFKSAIVQSSLTVMFLEDIQWADDDSLGFLERLADLVIQLPLLILCTSRPALNERRPGWPGDLGAAAIKLPVPPLKDADSRELVRQILRKLPIVPPSLTDMIVQSAGGNPFYIEELIKVLIEDDLLLTGESTWYLRSFEPHRLRVPATLTGLLQARLDRLPEFERIALQQAAVIGVEFSDSAIRQLNQAARRPLSPEQIEEVLQVLERRDMIQHVPSQLYAGSRMYRFNHAVLREVTYESVLLRDRAAYHHQVAHWFQAQTGIRMADYASLIAHHFELAGEYGDAAAMYEVAARRAEDQIKLSSAIDYYQRALTLIRQVPHYVEPRLTILADLGRLYRLEGRLQEALRAFQELLRTAESDGDLLRQAQAANALSRLYLDLVDDQQAQSAARLAERVARLTDAEPELLRSLLLQVEAAIRLGDNTEALKTCDQAAGRSLAIDAPRERARLLLLLSRLATDEDDGLSGDRFSNQLEELGSSLEKSGAIEEAADVFCRLAELHGDAGRHGDAVSTLNHALLLQRSLSNRSEMAETLRLLALASCRDQNPGHAVALLEEAATLAESAGNRYLRLSCRLAMGEALLAWGRSEAAEAALRQVIATVENSQQLGNWHQLPLAYRLLEEALTQQGRRDEAVWVIGKLQRG